MLNEKRKNKIILVVGIVIVLLLIWFIFISPYVTFKSREKEVLNGAKRYYEINTSKLPTGTKIATLSLKTLYDKDFVDSSPNSVYATNKCNVDKSFVKVRRENGQYQYYVYLECGMFKSSVDHEGPTIKLKGEEEITLNRGEEYKELGIESVKDNTDGEMDIKKVKIDSSKVNTNKNGTYEVTYTIKDSFNNETVKVRTIKVIQTLNSIVKKESGGDTYQGTHEDGYIKIDEILFRIVGINEDGSVKVVSNDALASINYEGIDSWLNDYFYNKLSDKVKSYLVKSKWCNEQISNAETSMKCSKYTRKQNVGLLSISDYNKSRNSEGESYLTDNYGTWTYNKKNDKEAWVKSYNDSIRSDEHDVKELSIDQIMGIKPALNIKKDSIISKGNGTADNPYQLKGNIRNGKKGDKVSIVKTGSYVTYSGYTWRVIGKDEEGNTQVSMVGEVKDAESTYHTEFDTSTSSYQPNRSTNLGYKIVNDISSYVKTSYFVNKAITIPTYKDKIYYSDKPKGKDYKVKLMASSVFELYSGTKSNTVTSWLRESLSNKKIAYVATASLGIQDIEYDKTVTLGVTLTGYLNKDVVIKDGDGTSENPYKLTK